MLFNENLKLLQIKNHKLLLLIEINTEIKNEKKNLKCSKEIFSSYSQNISSTFVLLIYVFSSKFYLNRKKNISIFIFKN